MEEELKRLRKYLVKYYVALNEFRTILLNDSFEIQNVNKEAIENLYQKIPSNNRKVLKGKVLRALRNEDIKRLSNSSLKKYSEIISIQKEIFQTIIKVFKKTDNNVLVEKFQNLKQEIAKPLSPWIIGVCRDPYNILDVEYALDSVIEWTLSHFPNWMKKLSTHDTSKQLIEDEVELKMNALLN